LSASVSAVGVDAAQGRKATTHSRVLSRHNVATALTITTLAWGAFSFGAVYPWGYWSMAALALISTAAGFSVNVTSPTAVRSAPVLSHGFVATLGLAVAAVAVQLVPLPLAIVTRLNANAIDLMSRLDLAFALRPGPHALSVWPSDTSIAFGILTSLVLFLIGTARLLSVTGARRLVEMILVTGVVLAIVAMAQKPLYAGKIYGFWTPQGNGNPFGPFVNRNHFAGWMLMAIPVALGYLCARIARAMHGVKPDWHNRLLWLSSPSASTLIMAASGIAIMGLSLVLTLSRSGIASMAVTLAIGGWFALRRLEDRSWRLIALGCLFVFGMLVLSWVGLDTILRRFAEADWAQANGRSGAWADARATFRLNWLTGTGLNTYQVANLIYQRHDMDFFMNAAHNDYLELAADGGVMLIVPALLCVFFFIRDVRRRFREDGLSSSYWLRAGAVTGLIAIALQETVEFSLQIPGNAALFAVVCAIALHRSPRRSREAFAR
jgi:O-antigen ligase